MNKFVEVKIASMIAVSVILRSADMQKIEAGLKEITN
jgi:hypothetical protein